MARKLVSIAKFAESRGFTETQARHWVQRRVDNGMARMGVTIQLGRRVLIDDEKFDAWLTSIQPKQSAA